MLKLKKYIIQIIITITTINKTLIDSKEFNKDIVIKLFIILLIIKNHNNITIKLYVNHFIIK